MRTTVTSKQISQSCPQNCEGIWPSNRTQKAPSSARFSSTISSNRKDILRASLNMALPSQLVLQRTTDFTASMTSFTSPSVIRG